MRNPGLWAAALVLMLALSSAHAADECEQAGAAVYQAIEELSITITDRDRDTRTLALWLLRHTDGSKRLFIRWYSVFCRHGQAKSGFRVIAGVLMIPGDTRGSI